MNRKLIFSTLLVASLTAGMFGCATTETIASKTKIVGNVKDIQVTDLRTERVNGVLTAQATISNTSNDTPREIYYRCHFYDINKFDLSHNVVWTPLLIYGGAEKTVTCNATSEQAVDFRVELSSSGRTLQVYK